MTASLIRTVAEYRAACQGLRQAGRRPCIVPTLGALHDGHRALMRRARQAGDAVVVSVFVNPTQFGPGEDYSRYPRDLTADQQVCDEERVDVVFAPGETEMYPPGASTEVRVAGLTAELCGKTRAGHFEGVATVVTKLLVATGPCAAVFGRKDFQQLQVIKRLVTDLLLPVEVVEHETVREADGLAMSSRNRYLSLSQRREALTIPRALSRTCRRFVQGVRQADELTAILRQGLSGGQLEVEYASVMNVSSLEPAEGLVEPGQAGAFVAARVGTTRLIDNLVLGVDPEIDVPEDE